jgi:DNA-binding transcriptional ArsR family regulator
MPINGEFPDYELAEAMEVTAPAKLRALADPLRVMVLDLLLERAATVSELAAALDRPKSTVAHHVSVLVEAGLLQVVRTRRVRAIEERYYGRTARVFNIGVVQQAADSPEPPFANTLSIAAKECASAYQADDLRTVHRHVRIPAARAAEFWQRVVALSHEFTQLPRSGDTVYAFIAGLYPTEHPSLPEPRDDGRRRRRRT